MNQYLSRFNKETAPEGHAGTILAGKCLPEGLKAPFDAAWGYLEGESMMETHLHPTDEIYTVFAGEGYCHVGDEIFHVIPGDIIQIPPDVMHTMECKEGNTILWAAFWW
ncbi:MAG: cupin domain-containing protein [Oscillospiraceae bacterium]|jgi:mannose-6-phosphate isomerase-like protein (cupin superfamily)|nr:cupin domain-containing protein [Oscillospiraceae bacterium]